MANFSLEEYRTVDERIAEFYTRYPDGSIQTSIYRIDGPEVIAEARVFRTKEDVEKGVFCSDFAREEEGKTPVNRTSHIENCLTSAVGRALANLGFSGNGKRPSRTEMEKVARQKDEHEAFLSYIRTHGAKVSEEATISVGGKEENLKEYIQKNWPTIKERFGLARSVVEAIESATGESFAKEDAA